MPAAILLYALAAGILLVTGLAVRRVSRTKAFTVVTEMEQPDRLTPNGLEAVAMPSPAADADLLASNADT